MKILTIVLILIVWVMTGSAQQKVDIEGAVKLSNSSIAEEGSIRYTGSDFEGYHNGAWLSLTQGGSSLASDESVIKLLTTANQNAIDYDWGDIVKVRSTVTLSGDHNMNGSAMHISGGKILGSGSETLSIGSGSVITNVEFDNVTITGSDLVFINCDFRNIQNLPSFCIITDSFLSSCNTTQSINALDNCNVDNSTFSSITSIKGGNLFNCVASIGAVNSAQLYDSDLTLTGHMSDNKVGDSVIRMKGNGLQIVSGNEFDDAFTGASNFIRIDMTTTAADSKIIISDNIFHDNNTTTNFILVSGGYSNSFSFDAVISIQDNHFVHGNSAIFNSSTNVNLVVKNNILDRMNSGIGVSASSMNILSGNESF